MSFLAKEVLIPGSAYDRTTTPSDKRQMTGSMYANNMNPNIHMHDPMSYIDTSRMNDVSQQQFYNGVNLPMPHEMIMPYMNGSAPFSNMMNGKFVDVWLYFF